MTLFLSEGLKDRLSPEISEVIDNKNQLVCVWYVKFLSTIIEASMLSCEWNAQGKVISAILEIKLEAAAYAFEENFVRALCYTTLPAGKTTQILPESPDLTLGYSFTVTFENEKVQLKIIS